MDLGAFRGTPVAAEGLYGMNSDFRRLSLMHGGLYRCWGALMCCKWVSVRGFERKTYMSNRLEKSEIFSSVYIFSSSFASVQVRLKIVLFVSNHLPFLS